MFLEGVREKGDLPGRFLRYTEHEGRQGRDSEQFCLEAEIEAETKDAY